MFCFFLEQCEVICPRCTKREGRVDPMTIKQSSFAIIAVAVYIILMASMALHL